MSGQDFTTTLLTKRYLQEVPADPRTGSRYAYGVTSDGRYYQVAGLIENQDGTFTAKTDGSLHFTYPLKSLIRSYNGPDFVVDGEGFLPYSPDHLSITATLADITGTVKVDGTVITPAGPDELRIVKPGSTITTGPSSSVILYFSDGSITHLGEGTALRVLPNTAVEKNDKDGIITKIRLKLTSGKIWNKVVRLGAKSEFNIETTGAIAGVRGTEFGIDDTDNLIVLSGSVAARRKNPEELHLSEGTDAYLTFDSASAFTDAQVAAGDGTDFKQFTLPADSGSSMPTAAVLSPSQSDQIINSYYRQPYNNNLEPRLNEIDVAKDILSLRLFEKGTNNPYALPDLSKIHVYEKESMDSLAVWDNTRFTVDPEKNIVTVLPDVARDFFLSNDGASVILVYEDTGGNLSAPIRPSVRIEQNARLTWEMLFGDLGPQSGEQSSVQQGQGTACTGPFTSIVVTASSASVIAGSTAQMTAMAMGTAGGSNCTQDVTQTCTWTVTPASTNTAGTADTTIGSAGSMTATTTMSGDYDVTCTYQNATGQAVVTVLSALQAACYGTDLITDTSDDAGYWYVDATYGPACWVLGDAGASCTAACSAKLGTAGGACDTSFLWDDLTGNIICLVLANAIQPPLSSVPEPKGDAGPNAIFAPYLSTGYFNRCWTRISTVEPSDLCGTTQNMAGERRVCRCI